MKPKHKRLTFGLVFVVALGLAAVLLITALKESLIYFYTPTDLVERNIEAGENFRLGGIVVDGSVVREGETTHFVVSDLERQVNVSYTGILPPLFSEGQGVIAEGKLNDQGHFIAHNVLAKHDEEYMPRELADALKEKGVWQEDQSETAP